MEISGTALEKFQKKLKMKIIYEANEKTRKIAKQTLNKTFLAYKQKKNKVMTSWKVLKRILTKG